MKLPFRSSFLFNRPIGLALILLLQHMLPMVAQPPNFQYANPLRTKIDPFLVKLGPTNRNPLTKGDAESILGIVQDLITNFCQQHFRNNQDTEFKFAILALVKVLDNGNSSDDSTVLEFSGGVSYFSGISSVLPSETEMGVLVDLALSSEAMVNAVSGQYPFVTEAAYASTLYGFQGVDVQPTNSDTNKTENNNVDRNASEAIVNQAVQGQQQETDVNGQSSETLIVILSACSAALVVGIAIATLAVKRQKKRNALWREDAVHKDSEDPVDDLEIFNSPKKKKQERKDLQKPKSLHMRDSLREKGENNDERSDAGSSLVGRLLTSAVAAIPACTSRDAGEQQNDHANNSKGSGDTSSCSGDSDKFDTHSKSETIPSEFEGNAVVKPNLVPITDVERFDDDVNAPVPPSRIASARRDELPIRLGRNHDELPNNNTKESEKLKHTQESFLAKYWNPITGAIRPLGSLPYFGGNSYANDEIGITDGDFTPRTAVTEFDGRWSEVSSDHQTEDFELDKAWDPDDASVNSGEMGNEVFSLSQEDKLELLKSSGGDTYNLAKLRTPPSKTTSPRGETRKVVGTGDIAVV